MPISAAPQETKTPPRKTLVFHIGDHKTGSTSIQYALAQKRIQLGGAAIHYNHPLNHNHLYKHFCALTEGRPKARRAAKKILTRLATSIRKSDARFAVISAETFEGVPPAQFKAVIETYFSDCADEIRIIGYVRPHAQRILSSFAEQTKLGKHQGGLNQFFTRSCLRNNRFMYHDRFLEWQSCFGDQFLLRPFVREALENGSVLDDFCKYAFAGYPATITPGGPSNKSFSLEDLLRVQHLQHQLKHLDRAHRFAMGWELSRALGRVTPDQSATKVQLYRELAQKIKQRYRADAEAMDQSFFAGAPMMQAELDRALAEALPKPQSFRPEDHFSDSELRSLTLMGEVILTLLSNSDTNWPRHLKQQRINDLHPKDTPTLVGTLTNLATAHLAKNRTS